MPANMGDNQINAEAALEQQLRQIIKQTNLNAQRALIKAVATQMGVSVLDCAAALLQLTQPEISLVEQPLQSMGPVSRSPRMQRWVRYRLDVGSIHGVNREQIQTVLVDESGVDKKRIGKLDIRSNYTLVELPDGMPADIFQILSEATLAERRLAIKRIKPNNNRRRPPRES